MFPGKQQVQQDKRLSLYIFIYVHQNGDNLKKPATISHLLSLFHAKQTLHTRARLSAIITFVLNINKEKHITFLNICNKDLANLVRLFTEQDIWQNNRNYNDKNIFKSLS